MNKIFIVIIICLGILLWTVLTIYKYNPIYRTCETITVTDLEVVSSDSVWIFGESNIVCNTKSGKLVVCKYFPFFECKVKNIHRPIMIGSTIEICHEWGNPSDYVVLGKGECEYCNKEG